MRAAFPRAYVTAANSRGSCDNCLFTRVSGFIDLPSLAAMSVLRLRKKLMPNHMRIAALLRNIIGPFAWLYLVRALKRNKQKQLRKHKSHVSVPTLPIIYRSPCGLGREKEAARSMFQILVAEDDKNSARLMRAVLKHAGYTVFHAENGVDALKLMDTQHIDLVVLDVMMPEMDGCEFTAQLRGCGDNTPVLMVTARQLPEDKRKGFISGTDDYMVKPVDEEELLLRIKALLRRAQIVNERRLRIGKVTLYYDAFAVERAGERQTLPQKEFYLLYKLLSYPDKIFTRIQLMDEIWGMESETVDTTVNVHINRLRRRFEAYPEFEIVSIRGIGYKAVKKCE